MRPLARWTIGPVSDTGMDILKESIRLFARSYPEFDRVVCHNHLDAGQLSWVAGVAALHAQSSSDAPCALSDPDSNPEGATGCGWKLSPPRLRPGGMELFIDNDIVIGRRLPSLDAWLADGTTGLVSEGLHRKRMFGVFDPEIPPHVRACAGLFGLPPGFDFSERIAHYLPIMGGRPLGGYDEQGLTVATVVNMQGYFLVPLSELHICEDHAPFPEEVPPALHFVAANRKPWHRGWAKYKRLIVPVL